MVYVFSKDGPTLVGGVVVKKLQKKEKKEPIMMIRPNDVSFPGVCQKQTRAGLIIYTELWSLKSSINETRLNTLKSYAAGQC